MIRLAVEDSGLIDFCVVFIQEIGLSEKILGSGTLVSIDGTNVILTADHVLQEIQQPSGNVRLFFPTRFDSSRRSTPRQSTPIRMNYLMKKTVGRGSREADGPDLGLLILPKAVCSQFIPSTKVFYNLTNRGKRVMQNPWPIDTGLWALVGAPAEGTVAAEPEAGFATVKEQHGLIGIGGVNKEFEKGCFDYLDILVNYNSGYEGPKRFQGCSGGGLWHLHFEKTEDGRIVTKESILSGVAFWQSRTDDGKRIVRCHGRKSIYQRAIEAL